MLFSYKILTGTKELKTGVVFCEVQIFVTSHSNLEKFHKFFGTEKEQYGGDGYHVKIGDNLELMSRDDYEALTGEVLKSYFHDLGKISDSGIGVTPSINDEVSSTCFTVANERAYHAMGSTFGSNEVQEVQIFANPDRYFANLT